MARRYYAAVLVCGASLLAYLILSIGPATVLVSFRELSWRLLLVILFQCVALKPFDTLAWRLAFPHERVPFLPLARALLMGQAVASATPTSMIGGSTPPAWTLRDRGSQPERFSLPFIIHSPATASQRLFQL